MGSVVIVGGEPGGQGAEAGGVGAKQAAVGPFVEQGFDEARGLAVGLGPIGARHEVADAQLDARGAEGVGLGIGAGAIRHDGLEGEPALAEEGVGLGEEAGGGGAALIGVGLDAGEAGAVVHGHVQEVIAAAPPTGRGGTIAEAMPAALGDTGQLFDIEMHQFAGVGALVAHGALRGPVEVGQARHPVAAQQAVDGGAGQAQQPGQPLRAPAPCASRPQDPLRRLRRQGVRPAMGNGRSAKPAIPSWR